MADDTQSAPVLTGKTKLEKHASQKSESKMPADVSPIFRDGVQASLDFGAEDAINTLAVQNHWHPTEMAGVRAEFFSLYGSLFFLGILLSVVFLFATLLMLYYKQVVEGYEDTSRFAIMQRVGMTKRDIRESVNAQMLLVFLLPLAAAALHLAFAQPMVWQILQIFGIQNLTLFLGVTGAALLVFALLYCAMYRLTSNAYYRIVSTQNV